MERIVKSGLKIDLHIHSVYSKHKDGDLVASNTINEIGILANKLLENDVNIASITDHDAFSFDMYSSLKKHEGKGSLKKVLPGVEFSVVFENNAEITNNIVHIITIFDDSDESRVKEIENVVGLRPAYKSQRNSYSDREFIEILRTIGIGVVLIGHQKNSITSSKAQKNDVSGLGDELLNELIFTQYFDAFEFKNRKNELFNKKHIIDSAYQENIRYITGSDCHIWSEYPKYNSNEKTAHPFTYIKCLPTFRGMVMAFTDYNRIRLNNSFFSTSKAYLDRINITVDSKKFSLPLSKGINAIIGDNSIGKSLILHAITNYANLGKSKNDKDVIKGYKEYLKISKMKIDTIIDKDSLLFFDSQGQIREKFEKRDFADKFINDMFLPVTDDKHLLKLLNMEVDKLITSIQESYKASDLKLSLPIISLLEDSDGIGSFNVERDLENKNPDISKLQTKQGKFTELLISIDDLLLLDLDDYEREIILVFKKNLLDISNKNSTRITGLEVENRIVNVLLTRSKLLSESLFELATDYQKQISMSSSQLRQARKTIKELFKYDFYTDDFQSNLNKVEVPTSTNTVHNYNFVDRASIDIVDNDYFNEALKSFLKKNHKKMKTKHITKKQLQDSLLRFTGDENKPELFLAEKLRDKFVKDLERQRIINDTNGKDIKFKVMSSGFNQAMYFNLLSDLNERPGIYIIDQPEDNVSQKSINDFLLRRFKQMSQYRQIILVTHNPQFIINLDVDNVIFMSKFDNAIDFNYGALEYEDDDGSIMKLIVDNIEGGFESLRKRWNRYEKNTDIQS